MSITVGASTPTGTYPITVTGNGGGIQQNTTVTLTVTASTPNFTISASPASLSVQQGNQGTSTITTTVSGGFNSAISSVGFRSAVGDDGELQSEPDTSAGLGQFNHDHYCRGEHGDGNLSHHGDGQRRRSPAEHDGHD